MIIERTNIDARLAPIPGTTEEELAQLLTSRGIDFEYETRRIEIPNADTHFTPDFWLPNLEVFLEVSMRGGTNRRKRHSHNAGKRRNINWVQAHLGIPVVLIDHGTWPPPHDNWDTIHDLIQKSRAETAMAQAEYFNTLRASGSR